MPRPRRTCRCTVASATPGRRTATSSTNARGCWRPASAATAPGATGCWPPPPRTPPDSERTMDFNDTPEEAVFRSEVRSWLAANASEFRDPLPHDLSLVDYSRLGRAWQKKKAAVGYGSIMWSKADGGLDGTPMQEVIFHQEESKYHVPV